jgi:hypothetical protein
VQLVAFSEDHVSVALPPVAIVMGDDVRLALTSPTAATCTLTCITPPPPGPEQLRVKLLSWLKGPINSLPPVDRLPLQAPEASQESALLDDQLSVTESPALTTLAETVRFTVAAGGELSGVSGLDELPPLPLHPARAKSRLATLQKTDLSTAGIFIGTAVSLLDLPGCP